MRGPEQQQQQPPNAPTRPAMQSPCNPLPSLSVPQLSWNLQLKMAEAAQWSPSANVLHAGYSIYANRIECSRRKQLQAAAAASQPGLAAQTQHFHDKKHRALIHMMEEQLKMLNSIPQQHVDNLRKNQDQNQPMAP